MVTNKHPQNEDFHWGIVLVTANADGSGSSSNICLPNNRIYTGIKISGKEIEILLEDHQEVRTNVLELFRKLRFFLEFKEEDLEIAFNSLCNETYPNQKTKQLKIKNETIKLPLIGELKYNRDFEWYEGEIQIEEDMIGLSVYHTTPKKLEKLIVFVSKQIQSKFHENMLLKIEDEMIALKNDSWLEIDEKTQELELPITAKEFRKRISIESMVFYQDYSSEIYCNDGDLFGGHSIVINIDEKGNYEHSNLAG